jgi:hypothetical protein
MGLILIILSIFGYTGSLMIVKKLSIMNAQITCFEVLVSRTIVQMIANEI